VPGAQRRLGRGLDALLPELEMREGDTVRALPCSAIEPNPEQPRRRFDQQALEELAASIRVHGVLQPVIVREVGPGRYQLVTGERRLRAAVMAGLAEIPAIVRGFSDAEMAEIALVENIQREELNAVEEAEALQRLVVEFGLTQDELARRLGRSRPAIANSLRLLQAAPEVREAVAGGKLTAGHARALLAVEQPERQAELARRVVAAGLSVRETERLVQRVLTGRDGGRRSRTAADRGPEWRAAEARLAEALGTRVQIRGGPRRGVIEIAFFGPGDLERLLEMLSRLGPQGS
jgi:ParB family chromosome partitioning protein